MKPILFDASESVFTSNGLGRLSDCISCFVEEERNGKYELEMEYPVSGDHFAEILHSRFIFAVPADGKAPQPFRIYAITKPIGGVCTIYAEHISYQLFHIPLNPFLPEASITRAFQAIKANAAEDCPFEFSTDKTTVANFKVDEPKSIREVLYGSEGSILDIYGGGEYEWDKYNVILHQHRGTDRGVVLRYGKDITDLTQEENIEDTITGIYPFWKGQNDEQEDVLVTLPEKVVHSANAGNFPYKRTVTLNCSNEFETAPTVTQLRTYATNYISQNNIGVPDVSITVSFAPLWQTEEYKDIANLERVNLCDTVTVHYEKLGVDATAKVIRTKYDVLNERYEEIELGSAKSSVASVIRGDIQSAIETAAKRSTEIENKLHVEITENTRKITGGLGGHVVLKLNADGEPEEILIMDTDDVTTAVNVWRFNMGGLGHSHSGYNGPFDDIALTMDGHINANMITVGTLNANLIKAGVLSDSQGINFIDMETGEMRIGASASLGGSTIAQHKANAVSTANGYTDAQLADYKDTVDAVVSNLQSQIDGQVMTWYYDYEPTMQNAPASSWNTTALRQQHEGDVFYWKSKGYAYRFMQSGSTWGWTLIQDTDITAAIAKAENAQDTADHKRRVFVTQPVPPYDIGDLWTQGSSGDLYRCETARASGNYVASDWKKATKYTDDSTFAAFRDGTYATFVTSTNSGIQSAQNTANSRITTYYQASQPTAKATGDLWIDTDDGNKLYRWNGSQWKSVQDSAIQTALTNAADAQSTADSKIVTFAQASQPTATDTGDLWIDTDDQNKMYRWSGSSWVRVTDNSGLKAFQDGTYATFVTNTNTALNKKVTTFYQTGQPTASTTGDLWIDTDDGNKLYRWNGSSWKSVQDTAIQSALTAAGDAQSTADKKIVTFAQASQPTATDTGDLWIDTDDSNKMYRWNGSAWKHVTDNSGLKAFQDGTYATFVTSTNTALGSKITTYYQASAPSSANKGDLWIDTDNGNKLHRYSGSAWVVVQDTGIQTAITAAGDAQATADSKIITFAQASQPTATDVGDLWIDTDDSNKMYRWNGSAWKHVTDNSGLKAFQDGTYATFVTNTNTALGNKITTYYQTSAPSSANKGDLWIDTDNGNKLHRYSGSAWVAVQDSAIQTAITAAGDAQATADSKIITFAQASQPTATDVGDLWIDTDANNKMYRWSGTQWVAYTDTSALQTWINGAYASTIQTIQGQIDGKAETYHQSADPSDDWTSSEYTAHTGDLWYDTSDGTTYYWNGAVWVSQDVPDEVFDAIDGKAQIFVNTPTTPYNVGDLWFNSATSDIMTCVTARPSGNYTASDWQKRNKYTDDTAVTTLNTSLNQTEIFNRLTNNGTIQGIYMQNGQLYINASYIQSGTLKLGGANNGNGVLEVYDASGNEIGEWTKDGVKVQADVKKWVSGSSSMKVQDAVASMSFNYATTAWFLDSTYTGLVGQQLYKNISGQTFAQYSLPLLVMGGNSLTLGLLCDHDGNDGSGNTFPGDTNVMEIDYSFYSNFSEASVEFFKNLVIQNSKKIFMSLNGGLYINKSNPTNGSYIGFTGNTSAYDVTIRAHCINLNTYQPSGVYSAYKAYYNGTEIAKVSSSSRRYKHSIAPLSEALDPHKLLALPIVQFEWNEDHPLQYEDMRGQTIPGIIAEDVEEIYPAATIHDAEGRVESWDERRLIPGMLALIQEQDKKIKELEARLAKIEEMLK